MAVVIIPMCVFVFFILFRKLTKENSASHDWRDSLLYSYLVTAALLTLITEILSIFEIIGYRWLLFSWILVFLSAFLSYCLFRNKKQRYIEDAIGKKTQLSAFPRFLLFYIFAVLFVVGALAILSAPNNVDAMVYHMPRVAHWIQNQSVSHYPTAIDKQLYLGPFAEFAIMHAQILSGGDHFAGLIQWFAMAGSLAAITLVAKRLGARIRGQIISAAICAAIPMGILQGSSTQNDYVVTLWLTFFVYYILTISIHGPGKFNILCAGLSLGLALLTKGTAYIYALPLLVWLYFLLRKVWLLKSMKSILAVIIIALTLNTCHYVRNVKLYVFPLGPIIKNHSTAGNITKYLNYAMTPKLYFSNILRNLALHAATPSARLNLFIKRSTVRLHDMIRVDVNNPKITLRNQIFNVSGQNISEDVTPNTFHLMMICFITLYFFTSKRLREALVFKEYPVVLISMFLLFCLFLKWQPWHSRLHLPMFVLWSPFIGSLIASSIERRTGEIILFAAAILSLPYISYNPTKVLIGKSSVFNTPRIESGFKGYPRLYLSYKGATDILKENKIQNIGLYSTFIFIEYPVWALMKNANKNYFRIEHVLVGNRSRLKSDLPRFKGFIPEAIIFFKLQDTGRSVFELNGVTYVKWWSKDLLDIYLKSENIRN